MPVKSLTANIIDDLIASIFDSEADRLRKVEVELVRENSKLSGGNINGFFYQGEFFSEMANGVRGTRGPLKASLAPRMERHLADKRKIAFDKTRVRQALVLVLHGCQSVQDVRDALPNSFTDLNKQLHGLERTRPEAWTIQYDERALRQYQKLRDTVQFYIAMKLLY